MKKWQHRFEFALLRLLEQAARLLPRPEALRVGALIGEACHCAGWYRRTVAANMAHVNFPSVSERRRRTFNLYRTTGQYALDFLKLADGLPPYYIEGEKCLETALAKKSGLIVITAHFGNWELLSAIFGSQYTDLHIIAKPMHNPLVQRWLARTRERAGVTTIYAHQALRPMLRVIRNGGIVAVLIDQHAGDQGTPVPFLGREASTVRTVAGIQKSTGCALIACHALLQNDLSYRVVFEPVPDVDVSSDDIENAVTITQRQHNDIIGAWVRENPEHWFGWFHRRFKGDLEYL